MSEQNSPDGSHKEGTAPEVPLTEWKSLYEVANRVRENEPWRTLTETDLFAVEDPVTKQVGLVSVLGSVGDAYGIHLYLPPEGLLFWLQFFRKGSPDPMLAQFKLRMLQAMFVSKANLERPDLMVLEQLSMGRPKKRLNGYPQFRSYRPGCFPWYLDADEVRLMRTALGASLEFAARRYRRQEPWLLDDSTGSELPVVSVYSPVAEPPGWSVRRERIQLKEKPLVAPPITEILDEETRGRLPELSVKSGAWQAGACYLDAPVLAEGRPIYPIAALVVDESDTKILEVALTDDLKIQLSSAVVRVVAAAVIKRDGFPEVIRVTTSEVRRAVESLRELCPGLEVKLSKKLDALNSIMSDLRTAIVRSDPSDPKALANTLDALQSKGASDRISDQVFDPETYRLKITLRHSEPSIWRRLDVSGNIRLSDLHDVFQITMGWFDDHLHEFQDKSTRYSDPDVVEGAEDESVKTLRQIAPRKGSRFVYTYDFGDSWEHDVIVEKIERGNAVVGPRCIDGRNACPPEDSGGIFGYLELLEGLADPDHPNHDETIDWLGEDFDPAYFDPEDVNAVFARLRPQ